MGCVGVWGPHGPHACACVCACECACVRAHVPTMRRGVARAQRGKVCVQHARRAWHAHALGVYIGVCGVCAWNVLVDSPARVRARAHACKHVCMCARRHVRTSACMCTSVCVCACARVRRGGAGVGRGICSGVLCAHTRVFSTCVRVWRVCVLVHACAFLACDVDWGTRRRREPAVCAACVVCAWCTWHMCCVHACAHMLLCLCACVHVHACVLRACMRACVCACVAYEKLSVVGERVLKRISKLTSSP